MMDPARDAEIPRSTPKLHDIAAYLGDHLHVANYLDEPNGILRDSLTSVRHIGLALDPRHARSIHDLHALDALLLHRWWGYESLDIEASFGVLGYHLPFDHRLALGDNPQLAAQLGMTDVELLHDNGPYAIGMIGNVPEHPPIDMTKTLRAIFGGLDQESLPSARNVTRIAVMGAMTAQLVHQCSDRGADLYLTGQLRPPAAAAVRATGIAVITVGHARSELYGLGCLKDLLSERWTELQVTVAPGDVALPK